jgi:hypothetical protein
LRLTAGNLKTAFRYLLDREPTESILPRVDVTVISRYFPEFEHELPRYLSQLHPDGLGYGALLRGPTRGRPAPTTRRGYD